MHKPGGAGTPRIWPDDPLGHRWPRAGDPKAARSSPPLTVALTETRTGAGRPAPGPPPIRPARPVGFEPAPASPTGSNQPPDARRAARHSAIHLGDLWRQASPHARLPAPEAASPEALRVPGAEDGVGAMQAWRRRPPRPGAAGPAGRPAPGVSENNGPHRGLGVECSSGGRSGPGSLGVPIRAPIAVAVRLT